MHFPHLQYIQTNTLQKFPLFHCAYKNSGISLIYRNFFTQQRTPLLRMAHVVLLKINIYFLFNSFSLCRAYLNTSQKNLTAVKNITHPARLNRATERTLFAFNKCPANTPARTILIIFIGMVKLRI